MEINAQSVRLAVETTKMLYPDDMVHSALDRLLVELQL